MWNSKRLVFKLTLIVAFATAVGGIGYAITNGQLDGERHPYVAWVLNEEADVWCSGVALSDRKVVTAAHCASADGQAVKVSFDSVLDLPSPTFQTGKIFRHPKWCLGCAPGMVRLDTHDVAVIVLDSPFPRSEYAVLPTPGLADALPMKSELTVVGYGVHGLLTGDGNKHRGNFDWDAKRYFALTQLVQSENLLSVQFLKLTANPAQGKGGICFGDSGGPALLGNIVLAVSTFGQGWNCVGVTYSTRLDVPGILDFINQNQY